MVATTKLPLGKISPLLLAKTVLRKSGAPLDAVVIGPAFGVDFASIKTPSGFMIIASDPVTGVKSRVGWYAVNVSANDVATSGTAPSFVESTVLLPEGSTPKTLDTISRDIHEAALALGIAIVGGHTEVTPELGRPIVVATAFAFTPEFITAGGAQEDDDIVMTKTAGIEGTSILAGTKRSKRTLDFDVRRRALRMREQISIVKEATIAVKVGGVHAMHDATEGGVLGGLYEMALASGLGFLADETLFPIDEATKSLCRLFQIDPLRLIGSGALLLAVSPADTPRVITALGKKGIPAAKVGSFQKGPCVLHTKTGRREELAVAVSDELWRLGEDR